MNGVRCIERKGSLPKVGLTHGGPHPTIPIPIHTEIDEMEIRLLSVEEKSNSIVCLFVSENGLNSEARVPPTSEVAELWCSYSAYPTVTLAPGPPALAGGALRQYPLVL